MSVKENHILFTLVLIGLIVFVAGVQLLLKTPAGKKVGHYLPTPFWIYFLSILLGTFGVFPKSSYAYSWVGLYGLPTALVLMLIGTPFQSLARLGLKALAAVFLAMATMFIGTIISYAIFSSQLPEDGAKMAGAMLATWSGGSANMLAVKELVGLSDAGLGPLIVMDTILSYGWLALLIAGAAAQKWFDRDRSRHPRMLFDDHKTLGDDGGKQKVFRTIFVLGVGGIIGGIFVYVGHGVAVRLSFFSPKAWSILLATTGALLLAATKARYLERWGASKTGTFLLYMVLASMGCRTSLSHSFDAPALLLFGVVVLLIHGILLFSLGWFFKIPLFLLATGSQANVGGPVSAPIVAGVYRPGAAHVGVLMAIVGATIGTYLGAFAAWLLQQSFL